MHGVAETPCLHRVAVGKRCSRTPLVHVTAASSIGVFFSYIKTSKFVESILVLHLYYSRRYVCEISNQRRATTLFPASIPCGRVENQPNAQVLPAMQCPAVRILSLINNMSFVFQVCFRLAVQALAFSQELMKGPFCFSGRSCSHHRSHHPV